MILVPDLKHKDVMPDKSEQPHMVELQYGDIHVGDLVWDLEGITVDNDGNLKFVLTSLVFSSTKIDFAIKAARGLQRAFPDREVKVIGYRHFKKTNDPRMWIINEDGTLGCEYEEPPRDYDCVHYRQQTGLIHYLDKDDNELRTAPFVRLEQS